MTRIIFYLLTLVFGILSAEAQQITGRIIDAESNDGIAYATIRVGEVELISNEDGYFTISGNNATESTLLAVSFIGYAPQSLSISDLKSNNNTVKLNLVAYNIGETYVSNVKPDPNQIMKLVNENLAKNYKQIDYKSTVFVRGNSTFKPKNFEIELKKSTDLSKSEVKEINREIQSLISKATATPTQTYSDKLIDVYRATNENNKVVYKLDVKKAVQLRDVNRSSDYEELQKSTSQIFYKVMDTTKFYRIKSGLIGSQDTISFSKEYNDNKKNKKQEKEKPNLTALRSGIESIFSQSSLNASKSFMSSNIDFIKDTEAYSYNYVEATYLGNDLVFVVDFMPKKSRAKYSGRLYINEADYAVVRTDYKLADGKKPQGINLKLLLGVKLSEGLKKGIVLYRKNPATDTYYLHYSLHEKEQYFYLNRPIKFIELTDGKGKDKIAYNIKAEGYNINKTEFLNILMQDISKSEYEAFEEKEFEFQILKKYDPTIWKGYTIIEPLEEMKRFEVSE